MSNGCHSWMGLRGSKDVEPGRLSLKSQEETDYVEEEEDVAKGTPLHGATKKGHYEEAHQLLLQGTEALNHQDARGRTPLFWATQYRHDRLVELLLSHGADTTIRDNEGNLCLHWAALVGHAQIARMLLEAGSDLNATNHQGNTPLHVAARERRYECLLLFIAQGAKLSLRNSAGLVALQVAQPNSPSWRALQAFSAGLPGEMERILSRDISRGFEQLPVPCLNGVDSDPCPGGFLYVTQNVVSESVPVPPTGWGRSQHCRCSRVCSRSSCPCILRSQRTWYTSDGRLVLDAARSAAETGPVVYECNLLCSCARSCSNRVVQRGLRTQLQLFKTASKGWGVRAVQEVLPGAFICQYFGEIVPCTEAARREEDAFCFVLDQQAGQDYCLDGRYYGNVGRFVNHSCQPNLVAVQVATDHEIPGIAFFSCQTIQAGEELGFDYGDRFWLVQVGRGGACRCESLRCRFPPSPRPGQAGSSFPAAGDLPGSPGLRPLHQLRGFALKSKRSSPLKRGPLAPRRRRESAPSSPAPTPS